MMWMGIGLALTLGFGLGWVLSQKAMRRRWSAQASKLVKWLDQLSLEDDEEPWPASPYLDQPLRSIPQALKKHLEEWRTDLHQNRAFTQHAAHELQTPLAVIKAQAELLLQSPQLEEADMDALGEIIQQANRLSKINGALILLTKIEQAQFTDETWVDLDATLRVLFAHFEDLIEASQLTVESSVSDPKPRVFMSQTLAEILLANLLQNAIRYNVPKGWIRLEINPEGLVISNPGKPLMRPASELFERFTRSDELEESMGLGLSIVQRIADAYDLTVSYSEVDGVHRVGVKTPNPYPSSLNRVISSSSL